MWEVVAEGGTVTTITKTLLGFGLSAINDGGQVVGQAAPGKGARKPDYEPVLWQKDKGMMWLESLLSNMAGFSDLDTAVGINNHGQIVGTGDTAAGERGYLATPVAP